MAPSRRPGGVNPCAKLCPQYPPVLSRLECGEIVLPGRYPQPSLGCGRGRWSPTGIRPQEERLLSKHPVAPVDRVYRRPRACLHGRDAAQLRERPLLGPTSPTWPTATGSVSPSAVGRPIRMTRRRTCGSCRRLASCPPDAAGHHEPGAEAHPTVCRESGTVVLIAAAVGVERVTAHSVRAGLTAEAHEPGARHRWIRVGPAPGGSRAGSPATTLERPWSARLWRSSESSLVRARP